MQITARIKAAIQGAIRQTVDAAWQARATASAAQNRRLRADIRRLERIIQAQTHALGRAEAYVGALEWESHGNPFSKECPECGAVWRMTRSVIPPDHDEACQLGKTAAAIRRGLIDWAEAEGEQR